jgi:hypothetical protein
MTFRTPLIALVAVLSALAVAPAASAADGTVDIIVRRDAGLSAAERVEVRRRRRRVRAQDAASRHRGRHRRSRRGRRGARHAQRRPRRALRRADGVVSAASNPPPPPFRVPVSDPWLKDLYAIQNTGQHLSTGYPAKNDADMDLREAWNLAQGAGVTVAVVDTAS